MQHDWQTNVHSGHNVIDRNGLEIGTVRDVHPRARTAGGAQMGSLGYAEVECDLPNLRKRLYIPVDSFQDCTGTSCRLNLSQDEIAQKGWDQNPGTL